MPLVTLRAGDWEVEGVVVAFSFRQRLMGIHADGASGLLVHAASIHGIGLAEPLCAVHLSRSGRVIAAEVLEARRLVRARSYWLLELPETLPPPPIGARLTVLPSSPA